MMGDPGKGSAAIDDAPDTLRGRADGQTVLFGHGRWEVERMGTPAKGPWTTVPEGTRVCFYCDHRYWVWNTDANRIAVGDRSMKAVQIAGPGTRVPDYTLLPSKELPMHNPFATTVERPTRLSELLRPNMGDCHWAACRKEVVVK